MPEWLRRMFSNTCKGCQAKDEELKRVYVLLADASQEVRELTKQLIVREAQAPEKAKPIAPVVRARPVPYRQDGDVPPWMNSLYTGGHLQGSVEEVVKRQLSPEDATVSGLGG
jgi:hypothetical protein